jgi:hypothetical protein
VPAVFGFGLAPSWGILPDKGERTVSEHGRDEANRSHREAAERSRGQPLPQPERPTVHYTELPEDASGGPIADEWNFYRREVGRLLAEGHEGRWVLIKGEKIIGIWDTEEEADQVRLQSFLMQPVLLKQVAVREPILRGGGYDRPWRN